MALEFVDLLECLEAIQSEVAVDPSDCALLLQTYRTKLSIDLLRHKGPSAESRAKVETLSVNTPKYGEQRLDAEPDKRLALLLSDSLKIDEINAVDYLITASEERGNYSAESAAGLFFEERQVALKCLLRLLGDVAPGTLKEKHRATLTTVFHQTIHSFVDQLLDMPQPSTPSLSTPSFVPSSPSLVARMIELLKDNSLEPVPGGPLHVLSDEAGIPASRSVMLQMERRLLSKCLVYALAHNQRCADVNVVLNLLDLMQSLVNKVHRLGPGQQDPFLTEECHLVLLSCLLALTPQEDRGTQERQALVQIVSSQAIQSKILPAGGGGGMQPTDGFSAVLRLAWGVLQSHCSMNDQNVSSTSSQEAKRNVIEAVGAGALSFLKQSFSAPYFKCDDPSHQQVVSSAIFRFVGQLLFSDSHFQGAVFKSLAERCPFGKEMQQHQQMASANYGIGLLGPPGDHIGTALELLSAICSIHPHLWYSPDSSHAQGQIGLFISKTILHDVMKGCPEVRVPFLDLLGGLACDDKGVRMVLAQMDAIGKRPDLDTLSWKKLFSVVIEYCIRYNTVLSEAQRAAASGISSGMNVEGGLVLNPNGTGMMVVSSKEERFMNIHEAAIMTSALGVFKRILENGSPVVVRGFIESVERELGPALNGFPLYEPLFQLMCHPIPNTLKAAIDEAVTSLAVGMKDLAPRLLNRLIQCSAVSTTTSIGVPRVDLVAQINEVEARRESYPETISFIKLLNSLVEASTGARSSSASSSNSPAPLVMSDGGVELSHFTSFVINHVLAHLWQRGYKNLGQKWELAAACFRHLELVLRLSSVSTVPPHPTSARQPPGYTVLADLLGGGAALQSLLHILLPGYQDLSFIQSSIISAVDQQQQLLLTRGQEASSPFAPPDYLARGSQGLAAPLGHANDQSLISFKEDAVVSGLRVLTRAFRMDVHFVRAVEKSLTQSAGASYPTLDSHFKGSPRRLASLLEYVCYQDNADVQLESICLATELLQRLPNLVELLQGPGYDPQTLTSIRQGYGVALKHSLLHPQALDTLDDPPPQPSGSAVESEGLTPGPSPSDPRALLVLRLILSCCPVVNSSIGTQPTPWPATATACPSFAHLLLGYDVEGAGSMGDIQGGVESSLLVPRNEFSALSSIERALVNNGALIARTKPRLYSTCLSIVYRMSSPYHPGSLPMLAHLSPRNLGLMPWLTLTLLGLPLPSQASSPLDLPSLYDLTAGLHQRCWLLKIQAMMLLKADDAQDALALLRPLLVPPSLLSNEQGVSYQSASETSLMLSVLRHLSEMTVREPSLSDCCSVDQRRLLREMSLNDVSVEQLFSQPPPEALMTSEHGDVLYDIAALYPLLSQRYEHFTAGRGSLQNGSSGSDPSAVQSLRSALLFAQNCNAYSLLHGAVSSLTEAWCQAMEVIFTRQYDRVSLALASTSQANPEQVTASSITTAECLYECLCTVLETSKRILIREVGGELGGASVLSRRTTSLVFKLVGVARMLLSKLQEQVVLNGSLGQASDPLSRVRTAARCHSLLRLILDLTLSSTKTPPLRAQLYGTLLQYLQYARGSKASSCAPVVMIATCQGWSSNSKPDLPSAVKSASIVDANQDAIDVGNSSLLSQHAAALVECLSLDALDRSSTDLHLSLTLHLLSALINHTSSSSPNQSSHAFVAALFSSNLPLALMQQLSTLPHQTLTRSSAKPSAIRTMYVIEAQLGLLLKLVESGSKVQRQASAQRLHSMHLVQFISGCSALSLEPEDPGSLRSSVYSTDTLRHRLHYVVPPCLRLVISIMASLPDSTAVKGDVKAFVEGHYRTFERVLREAAGAGTQDWCPGESEMEQADLCLTLFSFLVGEAWKGLHPTHEQGLMHAIFRLTATVAAKDSKSISPFIRSLIGGQPSLDATAPSSALVLSQLSAGVGTQSFSANSPHKATTLTRSLRVASLRCNLSRFLLDAICLSACPHFNCLGGESGLDPSTGRPTLMLFKDMAEQAATDTHQNMDDLSELLSYLKSPDALLDESTCLLKIREYGPRSSDSSANIDLRFKKRLAVHYITQAASQLDQLVAKRLVVMENALAIILVHLKFVPRHSQADARGDKSRDQTKPGGSLFEVTNEPSTEDVTKLGSPSDLAYFGSRLKETCLKVEALVTQRKGEPCLIQGNRPRALEGLDLITKTIKGLISA